MVADNLQQQHLSAVDHLLYPIASPQQKLLLPQRIKWLCNKYAFSDGWSQETLNLSPAVKTRCLLHISGVANARIQCLVFCMDHPSDCTFGYHTLSVSKFLLGMVFSSFVIIPSCPGLLLSFITCTLSHANTYSQPAQLLSAQESDTPV